MRIASSAVRSGMLSVSCCSCWSSCSSGAWSSGMVIGARLSQVDRGVWLVVGRLVVARLGDGDDVLVELVGNLDLALVAAGPPDVRLAQRVGLLERDRSLAVELEQREEARDHDQAALAVDGQLPEGRAARPPQVRDEDRGLLAHAHRRGMQVL